jgi:hypothetical protein
MITNIFPQLTAAFAKISNALLSIDEDAITGIPFIAKGMVANALVFIKLLLFMTTKVTLIGILQVV